MGNQWIQSMAKRNYRHRHDWWHFDTDHQSQNWQWAVSSFLFRFFNVHCSGCWYDAFINCKFFFKFFRVISLHKSNNTIKEFLVILKERNFILYKRSAIFKDEFSCKYVYKTFSGKHFTTVLLFIFFILFLFSNNFIRCYVGYSFRPWTGLFLYIQYEI